MVAPIAEGLKILHPRPVCHARRTLLIAQRALERGETIEAGCQLREAVREFLFALCEYHDCFPCKRPSPKAMAKALLKKGQLYEDGYQWLADCIDAGNKLAHCRYVRPSFVEACIALFYCLLDYSPELQLPGFEREGGAA